MFALRSTSSPVTGQLTSNVRAITLAAHGVEPSRRGRVASGASKPVSDLLVKWQDGDKSALHSLLPLVYDELRRLARHYLRSERPDHTLQSTALVHEAYLRLVGQAALRVDSRAHFFGIAAGLMREILVDHARMRGAAKRGANCITLTLDDGVALPMKREVDVIAVDDALNSLATLDPRQARIVELRFFGGLSIEETAEILEISPATVKREWATARLWLQREMSRKESA
jgi:RNA polymerase sigma factor (TIGR02999 family)